MVTDNVNGNSAYSTANSLNQYGTFGASGAVTYDANGNTNGFNTSTGLPTWLFTHDSNNRLVSGGGGPPSFTFSFAHDPRNRTVKRTIAGATTYEIYDGWNLIAEYDSAGTLLAKFVHGPKTEELLTKADGYGTLHYHENSLGSIVALTDASGNTVERYQYDAYGKPVF